MPQESFHIIRDFDAAPDSMLIEIASACVISQRSRASIYRDANAGKLMLVKVGHSTRIRVGDLRRYIGA